MFIKKTKTFLLTCLLSFAMCSIFTAKTFGQQGANVLRVDNSVADENGDGTTWPLAYKTLWAALNFANNTVDNWEIRVAKGTYRPQQQDLPFRIDGKLGEDFGDRIVLLGGFAGNAKPANPDQRDPNVYPTILSGDILGVDPMQVDEDFGNRLDPLTEDNWKHQSRNDNAFTVVMVLNSGRGNRIDGFTIEGGAKGTDFGFPLHRGGGGMLIIDSAIDVVNCTFRFNFAGIPPEENPEDPLNNHGTDGIGGGAIVIGSFLSSVEFTRFINCTFHDNLANQGGGLALFEHTSKVTQAEVLNSLFHDNRALFISDLPRFPVAASGGAIIAMGLTDANEAVPPHLLGDGGNVEIKITNCTVVNNWAEKSSGGFFLWNAASIYESFIHNSVFWHNDQGTTGPTLKGEIAREQGTNDHTARLTVRYSVVEGDLMSSPGEGPLSVEALKAVDPLFVDEPNKDFRVTAISPVLDAAAPETSTNIPPLIPPDIYDLDRNNDKTDLTPELGFKPRELDGDDDGVAHVDMGSFERFFTCCADVAAFDHNVNVTDLLALLAAWGDCPDPCKIVPCTINKPDTCPADIFRDCNVNVTDLLIILGAWGSCGINSCSPCPTLAQLSSSVASTQFPSLLEFDDQFGPVSDTWSLTGDGLRLAADGFKPVLSTSVTQANWWGFYEQAGANCVSGYIESFTIKYYDAVMHPDDNVLVPGSVIASFPNVSLFLKKDTGDTLGNGIPLYTYIANHAAVAVTAGTSYFVEIRNTGGDTNGATGCHWRWAWSEDGTILYSVQKLDDATSYLTVECVEVEMNLAFGLDIEFDQIDPDP